MTLDVSAVRAWTDTELVARLDGLALDHDVKWFYAAWLERRLVGCWCRSCETWSLPLRQCCPACWSGDVQVRDLSGRGTVFLMTRLHQAGPYGTTTSAPKGFAATIELADQPGLRLATEVVDCDDLHIGTEVEVVWTAVDSLPCPLFRPVDAALRSHR